MKKFFKKYWFVIAIVVVSLIRFFLSFNLPSFYITNLKYDDKLMINQMINVANGNYLGDYSQFTLVKGAIFPLILGLLRYFKISYSLMFTLFYILSSLYFALSCKKITNNKVIILIIYLVLAFNPLTYSSELFQRLYVNTISIPEVLIFLGLFIRVVYDDNKNILNYILLGLISGLMILTRNDNIWIYIVLLILFIVKVFKNVKIKNILINLIPIFVVILSILIMCFINYKYYNVFTYNELEHSSFKDAYNNLLKIKNDNNIDRVSITKDSLLDFIDKSSVLNVEDGVFNSIYDSKDNNELDDGNMIWFFRYLVYMQYNFKDGREASDFFKSLNDEINEMFRDGRLEKNSGLPVLYTTSFTLDDIKKVPGSILDAIVYTSTYQNVRTYSLKNIKNDIRFMFSKNYNSYTLKYYDYRYAENIIEDNAYPYEIIRIIYKYLTIILSVIALIIYIKNIKVKDNLNNITHIILLLYLIILGGVVYTDISAFHAIRYRYLSNVYILQSIFIMFNLIRFYNNKDYKKIVKKLSKKAIRK